MREGEGAPPWHLAGIRVAPVLSNRTGDEASRFFSFCRGRRLTNPAVALVQAAGRKYPQTPHGRDAGAGTGVGAYLLHTTPPSAFLFL